MTQRQVKVTGPIYVIDGLAVMNHQGSSGVLLRIDYAEILPQSSQTGAKQEKYFAFESKDELKANFQALVDSL